VVSNKERDERTHRALDEARSLLDRRPEPYVYQPPPRMLYDDPPEPDPFEPEAAAPERRQQPQPQPEADPWAGWNQWLETRLNAACRAVRRPP
jgi:hypothetical protein